MKALEALSAVIKPSALTAIKSAFDHIAIAEEEIERAMATVEDDGRRRLINGAFLSLCPGYPLSNMADFMVRAHCRELLARLCGPEPPTARDYERPTAAEMLAVMSKGNMATPLGLVGRLAYIELAQRLAQVLGRDCPRDLLDLLQALEQMNRPEYPGQAEEAIADLERKLVAAELRPYQHSLLEERS